MRIFKPLVMKTDRSGQRVIGTNSWERLIYQPTQIMILQESGYLA
jgi:hypothetical protein